LSVGEVRLRLGEGLSVAAVNGPGSTVVAGEVGALDQLVAVLDAEGVRTRRITVDYASHSSQVEIIRDQVLADLAVVEPRSGQVPFYSSVTGGVIDTAGLDADYWYANLRQTVEFESATRALVGDGFRVFVEPSAHPVVGVGIEQTLDDMGVEGVVVGTLRRDEGSWGQVLTSLAQAYVQGVDVDWTKVFANTGADLVDLPTYAFQRQRFWPEPAGSAVSVGVDPVDAAFWSLVEGGALASALELDEDMASVFAPALSSWRDKQRARSTMDSWRYRESWTPVTGLTGAALTGTWLALVPAGVKVDWLTSLGLDVVVVEAPEGVDRADLASRLVESGGAGLSGVVSLLDLRGSLTLVQALGDAGVAAPLWCVTRGAVSVGSVDAVSSPESSALWGLGRVAALELRGRWGGLVDVPEVVDETAVARVTAVLAGTCGEDQVAVRSSGVFARRLVRATASTGQGSWRARGTVLITGGTGGLGGCVARWVVAQGAEHVVLTSRRGLDAPGAVELRDELVGSGARVTVVACDAADRDAVADVLAAVPAEYPLTAVVHAAGVSGGDAPVESLTVEQLDRLMLAKETAGWHLHDLTQGLDLDAFVLFSSGAASWGSGGQPGYAAANAFLDGLAQYRRAQGLVATSIAWGAWAGVGMAAGDDGALARIGVLPMDPALAITALHQALADGETTVTVANTDWARFAPSFTIGRPSPLLSDIPEVRQALTSGEPDPAESGFKDRLAVLSEVERGRVLLDLVRAEAAATLGYQEADAFPASRAFREVGFDSVTAVDLRNRLRAATGLSLPATLVFDYPTPAALAQHIRSELLPDIPAGEHTDDPEAHIREVLAAIPVSRLRKAGLLELVLRLADDDDPAMDLPDSIDEMDGESLLRLATENTTD
ncbi:MAG: SDR family NAD(P)-dependent oxidoreductase, partial [Umezawaea sp.]